VPGTTTVPKFLNRGSIAGMGYNARNDEIRDNITRVQREFEAQHAEVSRVAFVRKLVVILILALSFTVPARAQDALITFKSLSPELALELARTALANCEKRGYQVAVAVVDRFGVPQVMLRDRFAGAHTPPTAIGKAWTAVSFRTNTTEFTSAIKDGGVRNLPGVIVVGGGVLIEAGGSIVGGIGVSGAPGGEADEACAKAGIAAIRDKIEF
jgi:uncharacterized protein GlcG (DUF336 family)